MEQKGTYFSGGEAQRFAIARSLSERCAVHHFRRGTAARILK